MPIDMKQAYIDALEAEMFELEYAGVPLNKAYELASMRAYGRMVENNSEAADELRTMHKEGL